jgi:DNA gyrase subunit A
MVVGMICVDDLESNVLVVSENGYGKRSPVIDYRETNRGGKGVKTLNITEKTGQLIAIKNVIDSDDLLIINESGILIRIRISDIRVMGRATQGVKLINLRNNDIIAAVAVVPEDEEEDVEYESVVDEDDDTPIDPNIADDEDDDEDEEILEDEEDEIEDENETNEE